MNAIERIAERRILEAIERGEFDRLPGAGKPLDLDEDADVPAELRVAYRILKNSGFVPPEVELRRDIANAEQLLMLGKEPECHGRMDAQQRPRALSADERRSANQRLEFLLTKLAAMRGGSRDARIEAAYYDRLTEKLEDQAQNRREDDRT